MKTVMKILVMVVIPLGVAGVAYGIAYDGAGVSAGWATMSGDPRLGESVYGGLGSPNHPPRGRAGGGAWSRVSGVTVVAATENMAR